MAENKNPFAKDEAEPVETDSQGNPLPEDAPEEPKPSSSLKDLIDNDLVDQETGRDDPLSATTEFLQGVVVNKNGVPLLKVSVKGWVGEEPVTIPAAYAGEFEELVGLLEKAGKERVAEHKKASKN